LGQPLLLGRPLLLLLPLLPRRRRRRRPSNVGHLLLLLLLLLLQPAYIGACDAVCVRRQHAAPRPLLTIGVSISRRRSSHNSSGGDHSCRPACTSASPAGAAAAAAAGCWRASCGVLQWRGRLCVHAQLDKLMRQRGLLKRWHAMAS
jgi:hypothetical protein